MTLESFASFSTVSMSLCPEKKFAHFATKMSTSTRITRSKGKSDGLSLPMRMRPTRRDTTSGRNRGTVLSTSGREHQQQMPTQMPHLTQSPEAASAERTATAPMLPPGPHRPLIPHMPLPTSPTSSPRSSAPLFQEDRYSSTSEEVRSDIYPP